MGWGFRGRMQKDACAQGSIRIVVEGNVRRIVSETAERGAANVTWDQATSSARFDWTGRARSLSERLPTHAENEPDQTSLSDDEVL